MSPFACVVAFRADRRQRAVDVRRARHPVWRIHYLADSPGLAMSAEWTNSGAHLSTVILTASVASLVFGLVLTMRQLTASPLTKLGLVGAPPAPPKR